jgi:hypothetical protein
LCALYRRFLEPIHVFFVSVSQAEPPLNICSIPPKKIADCIQRSAPFFWFGLRESSQKVSFFYRTNYSFLRMHRNANFSESKKTIVESVSYSFTHRQTLAPCLREYLFGVSMTCSFDAVLVPHNEIS